MPDKYAKIFTLGCRLNHADTALLISRLGEKGYTVTDDPAVAAELLIVNSCAVTLEAQSKSRRLISRLRRENPDAQIIAAGCAVELDAEQLLRAGADRVLTNPGKKQPDREFCGKSIELPAENFQEKCCGSFPFKTRAFIKVQEGCDNFCTYCIVPTVRGPSRSRDFDEVISDCRNSIAQGFPEIILTGVNTCNYSDKGRKLPELINAVLALPGNFRIRLSSTEPHPGDMSLPRIIAANPGRVCRFLHISMQHGCDRILQLMNRRYTAEEFASYVRQARELVPDIHIGTDIIVGFPGETDEDFAQSLANIERIGFANIHAFAYSLRPGTAAVKLPGRVPPEVVKQRMEALRQVAEKSAGNFAVSQYGKKLPVIFERVRDGIARGWSDNYLEITAPASAVRCGEITEVTANAANICSGT